MTRQIATHKTLWMAAAFQVQPIRPKAFTLVELLVVLGLIGVLIGLLLPTLGKARASAMQVSCASNLRQWAQATQAYSTQEHGWLPRRGQGVQATTIINRPSDWFNALAPMMRTKQYVDLVNDNQVPQPGSASIWMCPAAVDLRDPNAAIAYYFSYAMNMRLSTWESPTPDKINKVGDWSSTVLISEGPGYHCSILPANAAYSAVARHRGRINIAFIDGHVSSFTGSEIGCGVGDPKRSDVRWIIPGSTWSGPPG